MLCFVFKRVLPHRACNSSLSAVGLNNREESKESGVFLILHQRNVVALYLT